MPFNGIHKGTQAAEAWKNKMNDAKRQRREQAEAAARAALGPAAPLDQLDNYIREAQRASRQANSAMREQKRQQKIATTNLRAAAGVASNPNTGAQQTHIYTNAGAPPPPAPRAYEAPPPVQNYAEPTASRDDLYNHPIFGSVAQPEGVASVAVYRLPSDMPEHRGVTPGYLQSMSFDEFSEDAIRVNHGGGKYRAVAKDSRGRVIRSGDFTISGRAKLYTPTEEELHGGNGNGQGRITSIFQREADDVPAQYRVYMEGQEKRMERLEALIEAQYNGQHRPASDEDKLDRYKREMDAKEEQEQKRHDRRMQEIKAEMEANSAKEQARLNSASQAASAAAAQQMEFMKTIVMSQSGVNTTLMQALVTKKDEGGSGTEKFLLPMMQGMGEMMKVQNSNFGQMFAILKDSMGGEDNRTTGTRVLDMIEKGVTGLWDKAGDGLLMQIVTTLGKPKPAAVPQALPEGSAFQLPDGRVVPPDVCAKFLARYRQLHGVNPSMEVCIAAFVEIMNQEAAQGAAPQQIAGPVQQQPQQPVQQITQEQAEEFVRRSQQKAAEEATRAGKTTEEVQMAAKQAAQQAVMYLRQLMAGGQQPAAQPAAQPAPEPQQPAQPVPAPAAVAAAAAIQQPSAPAPQPAPAAVAAAAAIQPGPIAPPVQTATAVVQPGPIAAPGSISIPWMHRGFLQYAIDAFQARQNPIDFLFLSMQQGKISPDAKLMIGRLYEDAEDGEELKGILAKVAGLLVSRGCVMPSEFLMTFGSAPEGESWLETFLFACGCNTREDALKRLKEEE